MFRSIGRKSLCIHRVPRRAAPLGSLVLLVAALLGAGCGDQRPEQPPLPADTVAFYGEMQRNALNFPRHDGAWEQHFGDAPYYGLAFYVRTDPPPGAPAYGGLAVSAMRHNLETLAHAQADSAWFLDNLEETMMSTLGLIEYVAATGDAASLPAIEASIDTIDTLTIGLRRYIDIDEGMFAIREYGPTAITASIGLLNLQYAMLLSRFADPARVQASIDFTRDLVAAIDERAWDGGRYLIKPGDDLLELYPNTMMMLVLGRLYAVTGDGSYRDRAEAAFAAIKPLRSPRGGYRSPYSAAEMGAQTDDYSTLSSQNYLTLTLGVMYQMTGDRKYFDEAMFVVDFIRSHLYDPAQGHLLHHWIDGRIARPTDPEYFCSGCNLQFLYVLWYLSHLE